MTPQVSLGSISQTPHLPGCLPQGCLRALSAFTCGGGHGVSIKSLGPHPQEALGMPTSNPAAGAQNGELARGVEALRDRQRVG